MKKMLKKPEPVTTTKTVITHGRRPVKRLIQFWSAQTRWVSVLWIEPKWAPRFSRRCVSVSVSAVE